MRDGIYKSLKLGSRWKSLLRSCEREKERGETSVCKAQRAIIADLCIEISPAFIPKMLGRARQGETLLNGFTSFEVGLTSRDLGGSNSPFENDVLASAKRLEANGTRGRNIVDLALRESLLRLKERRILQIEQHCIAEGGIEASPIIRAARQALVVADVSAAVNDLLDGRKPKSPRTKRPIDIEEDLTKVH